MAFGFGYYSFGHFPFGQADYGEDVVIKSFPSPYQNNSDGTPNSAMKVYLCTLKDQANKFKKQIDDMDSLVDTNKIRSDILKYLGSTVAADIDEYESDDFKKSLVSNAIGLYRIKGTSESYRIRGKMSGYDVDVVNIWRIKESEKVGPTTDYLLTEGLGGVFQDFQGTLFTYPIIKNSLLFKVDGVSFAEDDGNGNIISIVGSGYVISDGTVNYETGDYYFRCTSAPIVGSKITVNVETGVEGRLIGTGDGGISQFINAPQIGPYPLFKGSLKIYANGILIGKDDGEGNIITNPGSLIACSGTIIYENNTLGLTMTPSPALGHEVTLSFDKTILSDFLFCNPDEIYEIPFDSGKWYSTIPPDRVAGNFVEGCGYCLTTYIKLRFQIPPGAVRQVNFETGAENFFDRLIRKLRDITPIHIRDLLYELQLIVVIDESENLDIAKVEHHEENWLVHSAFPRYDIIPADVLATDSRGYITGTVELV